MDAHRGAHEFERLLMHARWLSDLARRLVRDPATAEDLVQDTWHAALRQRNERVTSERGWLATLLSNSARARARSESARRERERSVAASESIEGPDQLVERAEAQRNLLARVLELDEPYRSTVLARYAQGASSAEIARQTHVNESTVRTRLARAHEQLRERIERREGGLKALAPLLLLPSTSQPSGVNDGGSGSTVTIGTGVGTVALGLKLGVVATIGLCGWLVWSGLARNDEPLAWSAPDAVSESPALELTGAASTGERVALTASEPAPAEAAPPSAKPVERASLVDKTTLDVTVVRDDIPASSVRVWIAPRGDWHIESCLDVRVRPPQSARVEDTDRFGVAAFKGLDPQHYNYRVGIGTSLEAATPTRFVTAELFPGHAYKILLGSATIRGRVFDSLGRERAGAGVQVCTNNPDASYFLTAAHTVVDERGEYSIGDLTRGEYSVFMDVDGHFDQEGETAQTSVRIKDGEEKTIDFGSSSPSTKWTGRLLNAFLEPFPGGGQLECLNPSTAQKIGTVIGADGRFELAFSPGTWTVEASVAPSPLKGFELGRVVLGDRDVHQDLVVPGARLRVRMIEPEGGSQEFRRIDVRPKGKLYGSRKGTLGADGLRIVDGLGPGEWELRTFPGGLKEGVVPITIGPDQTVVDVTVHWTIR